MALIILIGSMGVFTPVASAQNFYPEINITCEDPGLMEVYPGSTRTTIIDCVLENPTIHSEKVEVTVEGGTFSTAAPASAIVGAGSEVSFQVAVRGDEGHAAGLYLVNISAQVVEANGIQVSLITSPEYSEVTVGVAAYVSCDWTMGQGGGTVEAGDVIVFSSSIICTSNYNLDGNFGLWMVSDSGDNSWPSGFVDQSAPCNLQIQTGDSSTNCQFQILTPSNLGETWGGYISIWCEREWGGETFPDIGPGHACNGERIDVKVEPKSIGIGTFDLSGNDSVFGEYDEEAPIIVGVAVILLVLTIAIVMIRRRR